MRKIDFSEPNTVAWRRWRARCDAAMQAAVLEVQQGGTPTITSLYKSQKAFYARMASGFFGKCAYCEQKIMRNQHGDLDHYRPKKQPTDINWNPVRLRVNGRLVAHPGYYWLAYDWKNLLLSCIQCNQVPPDRPYGKGDRFPVIGRRASTPGGEINEKPLLLNPCVDDPKDHMDMDAAGVFLAKTPRGKATIEMLGLNLRDLPGARSAMFQQIETRFQVILIRSVTNGYANISQKIEELRTPDVEYWAAANCAVDTKRKQAAAMVG